MAKPIIGQTAWGQTLNEHLDIVEGKADTAQVAANDARTAADAAQATANARETPAGAQAKADAAEANAKTASIPATQKSAASGVASLDAGTKVPVAQLPREQADGVAGLDAAGKLYEARIPDRLSAASLTAAGPLTVNVAQYGVTPANTAAQNDAGLASLFAAHTGGAVLAFPAEGTYNIGATLPTRDNLGLRGTGLGTILRVNTVPMFNLTASIMRGHTVENIALHNDALGDHIYKMGGAASAGIILSSWRDCELRTNRDDRSIHFFSAPAVASNYFGNTFDNAKMWRNATATVPAFDFAAASPSGLNSNKFKGGWWHSLGATSTPFFRFTCSGNSSYAHTWEFDGVIGEQSNGGLIHMDSASNIKVSMMLDQDAQGNYTGDLFRFTQGAGGLYCQSVDVDQSGTSGVAAFNAGKNHLLIDTGGAGHMVGRIRNGGTGTPVVSLPARGVIRRTSNGFALPIASIAASQAVSTAAHRTVVATGTTQTLTLPDPATVESGTEFVFKNTSASALTVNTAAGLVDGAASKSLAQWVGAVFITDGVNWFAV